MKNEKPQNLPAKQGKPTPPVATRFTRGQSGNPDGRPNAGLMLTEWINVMSQWPASKVAAVFEDPDAPIVKLQAARIMADAASRERSAAGSPIAGAEVDRVWDRTVGKAQGTLNLNQGGGNSVADVQFSKMTTDRMRQLVEWLAGHDQTPQSNEIETTAATMSVEAIPSPSPVQPAEKSENV